jgi:four helix bundle protein
MKNFYELKVWEKAHTFVVTVYAKTGNFPREELYGLTNQIRRAAVSIPSNIAEGCGRNSDAELARFLEIASGSASELDYQLLLARDLGFLRTEDHSPMLESLSEIRRMLTAFIQKLKANR